MKYSEKYRKLDKEEYTTIRRYSKGKVGDCVKEKYPNGTHNAKIIKIEKMSLSQIPTRLLLEDTDRETREEAIHLIQSFYYKPIDIKKEKIYVYFLRKIKYYTDECQTHIPEFLK
jgi:hypothetical protein